LVLEEKEIVREEAPMQSSTQRVSVVIRRLRPLFTKSVAAWASVAALLFLASAQPSANAMEFEATARISLPDSADLVAQPSSTAALFSQLRSKVTISSNELALVSIEASNIKMARHPSGAKIVARQIMAKEFKWSAHQYACLRTLWTHESHWNYRAHNRNSGAHGIAQALPAGKMAVISTDWRTNPLTQIRWGLHYIDVRYSTPCNALIRFYRHNSY